MNLQRTQANDISSTKFNDCSNDISFTKFNDMFKNKNLSLFIPKEYQCDFCMCYSVGKLSTDVFSLHQERKYKANMEKVTNWMNLLCLQFIVLITPKSVVSSSLYYGSNLL